MTDLTGWIPPEPLPHVPEDDTGLLVPAPYPHEDPAGQNVPPPTDGLRLASRLVGWVAPIRSPGDALAAANATRYNRPGMCLWHCQEWYRAPHMYPSAISQWWNARNRVTAPGPPPLGAPVFFIGGQYGHIAISRGNWMVRSTDAGGRGVVADRHVDWFRVNWGHRYLGWTTDLGGVDIKGLDEVSRWSYGPVHLRRLRFGVSNSDSVRRLQYRLRRTFPEKAAEFGLRVTGNYLRSTDRMVRWHQRTRGYRWGQLRPDREGRSFVGPQQADRIFGPRYEVIR